MLKRAPQGGAGNDPFFTMVLIATGSMLVAVPLVPFVGVPPLAAWPWLALSMALHLAYFVGLTEAYAAGDMSQVYPIARGAAPLLTGLFGVWVAGERLSLSGWAGIGALAGGIVLMAYRRSEGGLGLRAFGFAVLAAVSIAGYSVVDGSGARAARSAHAYAVWLFLCDGVMMLVFARLRARRPLLQQLFVGARVGLVGGALSLAAYWISIWAMTRAPIALVAALRESSVLFAVAIAVVFLKERLRAERVVAVSLIGCGLVLLRFASAR